MAYQVVSPSSSLLFLSTTVIALITFCVYTFISQRLEQPKWTFGQGRNMIYLEMTITSLVAYFFLSGLSAKIYR